MDTEGIKGLLSFLAGTQIYTEEALNVAYELMKCVEYEGRDKDITLLKWLHVKSNSRVRLVNLVQ